MMAPQSKRRKALIIVDVQPAFLNKRNRYIVKNIQKLLKEEKYDAYIESVFHAEKGCIWDKQTGWILPKGKYTHTIPKIIKLLPKQAIHIQKESKSVFRRHRKLVEILRRKKIKEIHIVGLDTNDCVLATAYDSFDLGFFTYVIEDCVQSSWSEKVHKEALDLLRHNNLTNKSVYKR